MIRESPHLTFAIPLSALDFTSISFYKTDPKCKTLTIVDVAFVATVCWQGIENFILSKHRWSGVIGALVENETDIGLAFFSFLF